MSPVDFKKLFQLLTGYDPFPWQVALLEQFQAGEFPPSASLPTGLAKTSLIVLWLLAYYAALREVRPDFPRLENRNRRSLRVRKSTHPAKNGVRICRNNKKRL
jgi:hypothetical protein